MFDDSQLIFHPIDVYSDSEKEKTASLRHKIKDAIRIRLGLFYQHSFVGWSWGFQENAETFYMCNSGVLPEHRRKGLYSALMKTMLDAAVENGFQKIYSRHTSTNNAIIIAKLKAGFYLTNFELSDQFGALVHLTYYPNKTRRKVLDFRAGQMRPDEELKKLFKLS